MIEETVDIATRDGAMETFLCRPERGEHPPVLFLMDAPGIREELRDIARRLRSVGYCVLLPNLYYRAGRDTKYGPDVLVHGSPEHQRMRAVRTRMTIPPVMEDVATMIAFADARPGVKRGGVGVHGSCIERPYALAAAARYPDRVAAAASFYGTWLVSDAVRESPHLLSRQDCGRGLHRLRRDRRAGAAADGRGDACPVREGGRPGRDRSFYPGVHHGFAFPQRKVYDKPTAERHWERLIALYRRRLG